MFLEQAAAGDAELRRDVESLLQQGQSSPDSVDALLDVLIAPPASVTGSLTGRQIGTYSVHESIGTGGMGEVYRGRLADVF